MPVQRLHFSEKARIQSLWVIVMSIKCTPQLRRGTFFLCLFSAVILLLRPAPAMEAVQEALTLCSETIIPSLFPFLVLSSLLTALMPTGRLERLLSPLTEPLFHLRGSSAVVLLLGFTGGYPVGVRTATALYWEGRLSRSDTERLLAFCNNSGPGFLLGVVGIGVFHSAHTGLMLYAIHIAAALLVGLVFRFYHSRSTASSIPAASSCSGQTSLPRLFTDAVTGSFLAVLQICAFVLFFMLTLRLLSITGLLSFLSGVLTTLFSPFGMNDTFATALIAGILELSTGSACLQGVSLTVGSAALAAFLLGWGGLSVHCQSLLFLLDAGLPSRTYFVGKLFQGVFSAILAALLFPLL